MRKKVSRLVGLFLAMALIAVHILPVTKAASNPARNLTISGRGMVNDHHVEDADAIWTRPEQIEFVTEEPFSCGAWTSGGISKGSILKNEATQTGWTVQTSGTNSFLLACWGYIPIENDSITIPAGTQFTYNDGSVYEIANTYTIKYNGVAWNTYVNTDETITIKDRFVVTDGKNPVQIGFAINETFPSGDWITCGITGGVVLNDTPRTDWTIQTTGTSSLNLVCWNFEPVKGDVITIPSGTQFTYSDGTIYEISQKCSIKYDGDSWSIFVQSDEMITIKDRFVVTDGKNPVQIGFAINETFPSGDWITCGITGGVVLNDTPRTDWTIQTTGTNSLNLVCWNYEPIKNDIITIPSGTQFTYSNGKVYEFHADYSIKYDGTTWKVHVQANESITISGRGAANDHRVESGEAVWTRPEQIEFMINETFSCGAWTGGAITGGTIIKNEASENGWTLQTSGANSFLLACWGYMPAKNDIITIPAGVQFTLNDGSVYEIANDYVIKYNGKTWVPFAEVEKQIKVNGRVLATDHHVQSGKEWDIPEQIGFSIEGTFPSEDWISCSITEGTILKNDVPQNGWTIQTSGSTSFVLACWGYVPVKNDVIKIPSGTQFNYNGSIYEITEDYVIEFNGTAWNEYGKNEGGDDDGETKVPTVIKVQDRNPMFDVKGTVEGIPEQIGFVIDGKFAFKNDWIDCGVDGDILINGEALNKTITVQITKENSFNLVCWEYMPQKGDILTISAGTKIIEGQTGNAYKVSKSYSVKYDGATWTKIMNADVMLHLSGRTSTNDWRVEAGKEWERPEQIGLKIREAFSMKIWTDCAFNGSVIKNGIGQTNWYAQVTGADSFNLVCWGYVPAEGDVITLPAGLQIVDGKSKDVYEIAKRYDLVYHDGDWIVDSTTITYRGEELIEKEIYGLRIGMTKTEVERLFRANDAAQRNLKLVFTYPKGMFDDENVLQKGTYEVNVSATSYSGKVTKYNIVVKTFTKDAPTISFKGETERTVDAGKKFDVDVLKAKAKDGNGNELKIKYTYSDDALDKKGNLKKGTHALYLTATDDEGQSFIRKITLHAYRFADIVITGFYAQFEQELFIATNMKQPEVFSGVGNISTEDVLINGKSGKIGWISIDATSGSLYMLISPKKGDIITIDAGTTFLSQEGYLGVRTLNAFKGHTDGIGWIKDRLPNNGFPNGKGSVLSPVTGDDSLNGVYVVLLVVSMVAIAALLLRKKKGA